MQPVQKLEVWREAIALVEEIYRVTRDFPADERFGLTSQIRRAAVSVPSNIAEGYGRSQTGEYMHMLSIARGSLMELQTQLVISVKLDYLKRDRAQSVWKQSESVGKMLTKLISSLRPRLPPKPQAPSPKPRSAAA